MSMIVRGLIVRGFPLTVCNARFRRRAQSLPRAIAPVPFHSGAADARLTLGMQLTSLEREKVSKRRGNEPILVRGSSLPSDPRLVDASSARLAKRGANLMVWRSVARRSGYRANQPWGRLSVRRPLCSSTTPGWLRSLVSWDLLVGLTSNARIRTRAELQRPRHVVKPWPQSKKNGAALTPPAIPAFNMVISRFVRPEPGQRFARQARRIPARPPVHP
jgi:hypothetical protein